jgi:hypothetical protein
MQKKAFFFAVAIVCLLVGAWGYYQYQKPRAGTSGIAPDFRLTAEQLYNEYSANESAADKKYSGNVLEVTGIVKEKQVTSNATNVLLMGAPTGGVNCSFQNKEASAIKVGEMVKVKGRCTGFLMDVSLVDAVYTDK